MMGRPRKIIIIRHAQSEGNQNRQIHQTVPDHRVKLTQEGWSQAHEAGRILRSLLKPSDTLRIYTSPYRRTRETTHGILETLTSDDAEPSPWARGSIKVYEEPRLREQDFGNFQPSLADMETMWKARADYGHFFYRIPNGESAADAYDRVSGFNETLFRSFQEDDFPSVCVLVTHGLMTRVFLMRWYHWSVEYFEDLRNVNHCEMVIMDRSRDSGKFRLKNQLRTWSELKRQRAAERGEDVSAQKKVVQGASANGPSFSQDSGPVRRGWNARRADSLHERGDSTSTAGPLATRPTGQPWGAVASSEDDEEAFPNPGTSPNEGKKNEAPDTAVEPPEEIVTSANEVDSDEEADDKPRLSLAERLKETDQAMWGSPSGISTPTGHDQAEEVPRMGYFLPHQPEKDQPEQARADADDDRLHKRERGTTPSPEERQRWSKESGMGSGASAERLGDALEDDGQGGGASLSDQEAEDKSVRGSVY